MRFATLGGAAALVLAGAIVGCSDQTGSAASGVTAPHGPFLNGAQFRIHGTGTLSIATPAGIVARALPAWTASGSARDGVVQDESGTSPMGVIAISAAIVKPTGGDHRSTFTDAEGNQIIVVMAGGPDGGPMRAMRLYRNGVLQAGADYEWAAVAGGWSLRAVNRVVMRDGQAAARITTNAAGAVEMASRGGVGDVLVRVGAAAARAMMPRELAAQDILSGVCRKVALDYYAAEAALSAALMAFERAPSTVTAALVVAAAAKATAAEMAYWLCQQNQESRKNPIIPILGLPGGSVTAPPNCGNGTNSDPFCGPSEVQ